MKVAKLNDLESGDCWKRPKESLKLPWERRSKVLRLRYGIGEREHTLQEVTDHLGITRERIRQIQVKAEDKLERRVAAMGFEERAKPATAVSVNIEMEGVSL